MSPGFTTGTIVDVPLLCGEGSPRWSDIAAIVIGVGSKRVQQGNGGRSRILSYASMIDWLDAQKGWKITNLAAGLAAAPHSDTSTFYQPAKKNHRQAFTHVIPHCLTKLSASPKI